MTDSAPETQPDPQPETQPDTPSSSAASPEAAAAKPRSPVERAIVWGIIAVLVIVVVLEARSRSGFKAAYNSLLDRIEQGEQTGELMTGLMVTDILNGRKPDDTRKVRGLTNGAVRVDLYSFGGILQKRVLHVYYGSGGVKGQPEVVAVTSQEAEKYVPRTTSGAVSEDEGDAGMGGTAEKTQSKGKWGGGKRAGGRKRPAGEKTKGTSQKKSVTKGTPESKKSKAAPKKSKPESKKSKAAPVKAKSTPSAKKK